MAWQGAAPCVASNSLTLAAFLWALPSAVALAAQQVPLPKPMYNGAPFKNRIGSLLPPNPSTDEDYMNPEISVYHLNQLLSNARVQGSPHLCDMCDQAVKGECLSVERRNCMWTRVQTRDPFKRIQSAKSYCLPCKLDEEAIPCWNVGAWVNGMQVTHCEMNCMHQERVMQPQYACNDSPGALTQSQCFDKGTMSGSKCMFVSFTDKAGGDHGSCGPCELQGTGGWGCPANGADFNGGKVTGCVSQCDVLCAGPPACPPTVAPPPPLPPPTPGIAKVTADEKEMVITPTNLEPPLNPAEGLQAIFEAAEKSGRMLLSTPAPKVYWPVIYYRSPGDYLYTTGPPPIGMMQLRSRHRFLQSPPAAPAHADEIEQTEADHKRSSILSMLRRR